MGLNSYYGNERSTSNSVEVVINLVSRHFTGLRVRFARFVVV